MWTSPSSAQGPWLCVRSQGPAHPQRRTLTPAGLGQQPQAAHCLPLTVSGAYRQVADDQQIPSTGLSHRWLDRHVPARRSVRIRPAPQEHRRVPGTPGAQSTRLSSPHPGSTLVCTSGRSQGGVRRHFTVSHAVNVHGFPAGAASSCCSQKRECLVQTRS